MRKADAGILLNVTHDLNGGFPGYRKMKVEPENVTVLCGNKIVMLRIVSLRTWIKFAMRSFHDFCLAWLPVPGQGTGVNIYLLPEKFKRANYFDFLPVSEEFPVAPAFPVLPDLGG